MLNKAMELFFFVSSLKYHFIFDHYSVSFNLWNYFIMARLEIYF